MHISLSDQGEMHSIIVAAPPLTGIFIGISFYVVNLGLRSNDGWGCKEYPRKHE